jgi:hypothetical protein
MADTVKSLNAGTNITLKKPFFCPDNGEGVRIIRMEITTIRYLGFI